VILLKLSYYGRRFAQGAIWRVMGLCEKQEDLRIGNEVFFGLADLENEKCQNRYYVAREKEPIISCFRAKVPYFLRGNIACPLNPFIDAPHHDVM